MYTVVLSRQANKDSSNIIRTGLEGKVKELLAVLEENPFQSPPEYEKLQGDLKGMYSRRINHQHRLVYMVYKKEKIVKILSMWSHYENV